MRLRATLFFPLLVATPLSAGQPISESMVQCGALYDVSASWVATPEKSKRLDAVADAWMQAAEARALKEGRGDPVAYVSRMWGSKGTLVASKGKTYVFSQDFRDWMGYCRALGREMNVPTKP